jgi:hypothetical protein
MTTNLSYTVFMMMAFLMFGIAIFQYPYEMYQHPDGSITVYRSDPYGLLPLLHFQNLQHLIWSFGVYA